MLRMLVVDDHRIVRQSLQGLLRALSAGAPEPDACPGTDVVRTLRQSPYDLMLIGPSMAGIDRIELLRQVRSDWPKLPVLMLADARDEQFNSRLLRAGAAGVLTGESSAAELAEAITSVSRGHRYVSPHLAEQYVESPADGVVPKESLSDREYQVMVSIASGKRIKQIADDMSLSVKTVSTYHTRVLQKLKLANDAGLIRYAIEQGVIRDGLAARQKMVLADMGFRTASAAATIREIWRVRKDVFILMVIISVLAYIILNYAIRTFVF